MQAKKKPVPFEIGRLTHGRIILGCEQMEQGILAAGSVPKVR